MIPTSFDKIEKSDLESLLINSVPEGRALEYKLLVKASSDSEKKEFLADVASFANTGGGDMLFGVCEDKGVPQSIPGLEVVDTDKEILRLEEIIRFGIEPRLLGLQIKVIPGFKNGPVLLIRIPQSWNGPHIVCFQSWSRFFTRGSAGKSLMNVNEIKNAFLLSESIPQKMRAFRDGRIAMIETGKSITTLSGRQHLVLHFLPLVSFGQHFSLNMTPLFSGSIQLPNVSRINPWSRLNLDGYIDEYFGAQDSGPAQGYTQVFRNGIVEVVDCNVAREIENHGRLYIQPNEVEKHIVEVSKRVTVLLKRLDVPLPVFLFTTLLGVNGLELYSRLVSVNNIRNRVDRDRLLLPDVELSDPVSRSIKTVCDMFRQSFGAIGSPNFDGEGNWTSA